MKEPKHGAKRLLRALRDRMENPQTLFRIAAALDYMPEQLRQDIEALDDLMQQYEETQKDDE